MPKLFTNNRVQKWEVMYASGLSIREISKITGDGRKAIAKKIANKRPQYKNTHDLLIAKTVKRNNGCIEWTGGVNNTGRPMVNINGRLQVAYRYFYEVKNGKIPEGLNACHKCDNGLCVNPDHIFLGTQKDNMIDCFKKGRSRQCRLSTDTVSKIKRLFARGLKAPEIIRRFGINKTTIYDIKNNKRYQWV